MPGQAERSNGAAWPGRPSLAAARETALLAAAALGLFLAPRAVPILGHLAMVTGCPVAIALARARRGPWSALACVAGVAAAAVGLLGGRPVDVGQAVELSVAGWALGEGLARRWRLERTILVGAAGLLLGSAMALLIAAGGLGLSGAGGLAGQAEAAFQETLRLYRGLGVGEESARGLAESWERLRRALGLILPALLVAGSLLNTVVNYLLARAAGAGDGQGAPPVAEAVGSFRLPEALVWVFIGAAALYLAGGGLVRAAGLNLLVAMATLYFLQGISITAFLLRRFGLPRALAALTFLLILVQPMLALLVAGVGLFDIWVSFRRVGSPSSSGA
jgi:hypothetical protein